MSDLIFYDNKKLYSTNYVPFEQKEIYLIIKYFSDISCIYGNHYDENGFPIYHTITGPVCKVCNEVNSFSLNNLEGVEKASFMYRFGYKYIRFYFYRFDDDYMSIEVSYLLSISTNKKFVYDGYMIDGYDGLKCMMEKIKEWLLMVK